MATNRDEERVLWGTGEFECVMISCCAGAELQVRRTADALADILLSELYPTKSDVYERARDLREEFGGV